MLFFANLTYAFGQSATAATLAWIAMYPAGRRSRWWLVALFLLATLAFLSHVGLFPLLLAMMCATAVLYRWLGGVELRPASYQIVLAAVLAAVVSVVLYYGHFPESYRTLQRLKPGASDRDGECRARGRDASDREPKRHRVCFRCAGPANVSGEPSSSWKGRSAGRC